MSAKVRAIGDNMVNMKARMMPIDELWTKLSRCGVLIKIAKSGGRMEVVVRVHGAVLLDSP